MNLIDPSDITLTGWDDVARTYTLSKFPAVQGREIVMNYPLSALPKLGDYKVNEEIMMKLMSFVAVDINGKKQVLNSRFLIDNHVPDWETLSKLEMAMMEKNVSFFGNGQGLTSLESFVRRVIQSILGMLTDLSAQSSPGAGPLTQKLRTIYSLEDAFILWETIVIPRYNEHLARKAK